MSELKTGELKTGDKAPDFTAQTAAGGAVKLSDLHGQMVVLYFYPKDDTSGCTKEAQGFSEAAEAFAEAGAVVVGVSPDSVASHDKFIAKYDLKLKLASDPDHAVAEAYGAWVEKSMYGRKYMGVDRSTFLIGPDGALKAVWRKVKVPGHVEAVLKAVAS